MKKKGRAQGGTLVAATATFLVLALAGYYYLRTTSNWERLTGRNLRELARIAGTVEDRVNNLESVMQSLAVGRPLSGDGDEDKWAKNLRSRASLIPGLEIVCPEREESQRADSDACQPLLQAKPENSDEDEALPADLRRVWLRTEGEHLDLQLGGKETVPLRARWSLAEIHGVLESGFFDHLFLADAEGEVFLSKGDDRALRLLRIPQPVPTEDAESGYDAPPAATSEEVPVAGGKYLLFLQPIRLELPSLANVERGTLWTLGGLVEKSRFRSESLSFDPPQLLFLGLFLVLTLLAIPFLRIGLMGERERVEVGGVLLLGFTLIVASGVCGIMLADTAYYWNFRHELDEQLKSIADLLEGNLGEELRLARAELERQSEGFLGCAASDVVRAVNGRKGDSNDLKDPWEEAVRKGMLDEEKFERTSLWESEGSCASSDPEEDLYYESFLMVYWISPSGMQMAKWTPREQNTTRVSVAKRAYFSEIQAGRGWKADESREGVDQCPVVDALCGGAPSGGYYLEAIQSLTTGEHQAALSMPFRWPECDEDCLGAAAMIIRPIALDRPVLPPGVEFAVIDAEGHTLFHSRAERGLGEDFFEETQDNPLLRSKVAAKAPGVVDGSYLGRRSRLFVRPVTGSPLSLVVSLDKSYLGTVNVEALFAAGALFAAYALVLLVLFCGVEALLLQRLAWAWPELGRPDKYCRLLVVLATFAVLFVLQIVFSEWLPAHPSTLLVPFQVLSLSLVTLTAGMETPRPGETRFDRWRHGPRIGWLSFLLATVLVVLTHRKWSLPDPQLLGLQLVVAIVGAAVVAYHQRTREVTAPGDDLAAEAGKGTQLPYLATVLLILLVVGLLPAYMLLQTIFLRHADLMVRHHQLHVADALGARDREVAATDPEHDAVACGASAESALGEVFFPFFDTRSRPADRSQWRRRTVCNEPPYVRWSPDGDHFLPNDEDASKDVRHPDVGAQADQQKDRQGEQAASGGGLGSGEDNGDTEGYESLHTWLHDLIGRQVPFVTDFAVEMRQLFENRALQAGPEGQLELVGLARALQSRIPDGLGEPTWGWGLTALVSIGAFIGLVAWFGRRVFLLGMPSTQPIQLTRDLLALEGEDGPHLCIVCTRSMDRVHLKLPCVHYVNLVAQVSGVELVPSLLAENKTVICIDFFDHRFTEPERNSVLLEQLEQLAYAGDRRLVLVTSRQPTDLLRAAGAVSTDDSEYLSTMHRWARLFGRFTTVYLADDFSKKLGKRTEELRARALGKLGGDVDWRHLDVLCTWADRECGDSRQLSEVAFQLLRRPDLHLLGTEELIDHVLDMAEGYYTAIWAILRDEEKLVLAQLAAGAVVNPKNREAIRRLLARGLLRRAPVLSLMNESFGRFIRETVPTEEIIDLERGGRASAWQQLRFPLYLGLAAAAIFLLVTQQELFSRATAFVSTIGVSVGALLRLLTVLQRKPLEGGKAV